MEKEGPFEIPVFRTSPRALRERRLLFHFLRAATALSLLLAAVLAGGEDSTRLTVCLGAALGLVLALFLLPLAPLFAPFAAREVRLMEGALEERRGRYTRLL